MALILAPWALLIVAAMWGISFVWMKDILDKQDVLSFLASRFIMSALLMLAIRPSILRKIDRDLLRKGTLTGVALWSGFTLQTFGLERSTPAITGFVTGLYVVLTPIIAALIMRERLPVAIWRYVVLATIGLGILSISGWQVGTGELLVLASALCYAIHITMLSAWSARFDTFALTFIQLATCALLSAIPASLNGFQAPPDTQVWGVVIFTAVACTVIAFIIQTWSQARISATKVAVILTMEVVFAALFSVALGREPLTWQVAIGGACVVVAMLAIVQPRFSPTPAAK